MSGVEASRHASPESEIPRALRRGQSKASCANSMAPAGSKRLEQTCSRAYTRACVCTDPLRARASGFESIRISSERLNALPLSLPFISPDFIVLHSAPLRLARRESYPPPRRRAANEWRVIIIYWLGYFRCGTVVRSKISQTGA